MSNDHYLPTMPIVLTHEVQLVQRVRYAELAPGVVRLELMLPSVATFVRVLGYAADIGHGRWCTATGPEMRDRCLDAHASLEAVAQYLLRACIVEKVARDGPRVRI